MKLYLGPFDFIFRLLKFGQSGCVTHAMKMHTNTLNGCAFNLKRWRKLLLIRPPAFDLGLTRRAMKPMGTDGSGACHHYIKKFGLHKKSESIREGVKENCILLLVSQNGLLDDLKTILYSQVPYN